MEAEKNSGKETYEESVQEEAREVLSNPEVFEELNNEALKDKGMLQKIAEKTHRGIKAVSLAFALLVASEAKDAAAAEMNQLAKLEQKDFDKQKFVEKFKVTPELRKLQDYYAIAGAYINFAENVQNIFKQWNKVSPEDKKKYLKLLNEMAPSSVAMNWTADDWLAANEENGAASNLTSSILDSFNYEPVSDVEIASYN